VSALDRLMDAAGDVGARVEWGRRGRLHTVRLVGPESYEYDETAIGETREQAAAGLLDTAFGHRKDLA
jgi:hypothetical protein